MTKSPEPSPRSPITMYAFKKLAGAIKYLNLDAPYLEGMERCVHGVQLDFHEGRVRARFMMNVKAIIEHLMKTNNWNRDESIEWFHTNIECARQGDILWAIPTDDEDEEEIT